MRFVNQKTRSLLIPFIIAIAFSSLALIKVVNDIILPILFPQPPQPSPPIITTEPPPSQDSLSLLIIMFYNTTPYISPLAWVAFLLTLIWKGKIRIIWKRRGYDYEVFNLLAKMRGSDTRIKILRSLYLPKNRLQLAKELEMHWKSIDSHIDVLIRYSLVKEVIAFGTARYLMITDKGKEVLELLENDKADSM